MKTKTYKIDIEKINTFLDILNNNYLNYLVFENKLSKYYLVEVDFDFDSQILLVENDEDFQYCEM